jgi:hypothetical protein
MVEIAVVGIASVVAMLIIAYEYRMARASTRPPRN